MEPSSEITKTLISICDKVVEQDCEKDYVLEYKKFDWSFNVFRMSHYF